LIFRHRTRTIKSAQVTGPDRPSVALEMPRLTVQCQERSWGEAGERLAERRVDSVELGLLEKP